MSLHDAHLQQALKHAPDNDVAPDATTRREVLNYAAKATRKKSQFALRALWKSMSGWPLAGLGSAMAVMLVMVVFWDKHTTQTTFDNVAPRQVAQAERSVSAPATVAPQSVIVADAAPQKTKMQAQEKLAIAEKDMTAATPVVVAAAPVQLENKDETVASNETAAEKVAIAPQAAPVLEKCADDLKKTDADKVGNSANVPAVSAGADSQAIATSRAKAAAAAPMQVDALSQARARGAANAANDIKAGISRILTLRKPVDGEAIDALTGYRLEFIQRPPTDALQAEIDAYNQEMRARRAN